MDRLHRYLSHGEGILWCASSSRAGIEGGDGCRKDAMRASLYSVALVLRLSSASAGLPNSLTLRWVWH